MGWQDDIVLDPERIPLLTPEEAERLWSFHRSPAHRSLVNRLFRTVLWAYAEIEKRESEIAGLLQMAEDHECYIGSAEFEICECRTDDPPEHYR